MVLNPVVAGRDKLEAVMVGNLVYTGTATKGLLSAKVDLDVDDVVLLNMLWTVICCTVENQIAGLHLIELEVDRTGVILVSLVSTP